MADRYFVADTNVIVSAAIFSSLNPSLALKRIISVGKLAFSESVLQEYAEILSDSKFDRHLSIQKRLVFLEKLIAEGTLIPVTKPVSICRDPKDDKYLELAEACNALCIITGDKDLLVLHPFGNTAILTPADFLDKVFP